MKKEKKWNRKHLVPSLGDKGSKWKNNSAQTRAIWEIIGSKIESNSSTKFFSVIQWKDESTRAYLKRFNEKKLKMEGLLQHITIKTLIDEVHNFTL
jgi:hypothetical protein